VRVSPVVQAAFALDPVSHRSGEFRSVMDRVRGRLRHLTGAQHVELMNGSGTTANDAIAAQLSLINGYGLIVTNGEFGDRLIDHANRFNLKFDTGRHAWGEPLRYDAIDRTAKRDRHQWIWMVHGETSTGMLNDLPRMKQIAHDSGARLIVDCIGSLGTVPLDLVGVFLASGTSGKGMASYAGVAMVFLDHPPRSGDRIPRSLDLGFSAQQQGIPFTMLSNHLVALDRAMDRIEHPDHFAVLLQRSVAIRTGIEAAGFEIVTAREHASPAVFTLAFPPEQDAASLVEAWAADGVLVHGESGYLRERNWFQICLMGDVSDADIARLMEQLRQSSGKEKENP
jgi:aspartate aminotransferase-like enzyme